MNRNESERRQTKKRNTLSLSEINNKYTSFFSVLIFIFIYLFKFFGHVQLVQQAYFYEFHFGHVLYNQMCNCVHLHNDVMDRIDRHNDNQSLQKKNNDSNSILFEKFLPVNPSFLLHVGHVHLLRFFLSTLDAVNGDIASAPKNKIEKSKN